MWDWWYAIRHHTIQLLHFPFPTSSEISEFAIKSKSSPSESSNLPLRYFPTGVFPDPIGPLKIIKRGI
jgi:hypothetical protein